MEDTQELTKRDRAGLRESALRTATQINPNTYLNNSQAMSNQPVKISVEQVLTDAEKIYQWLIKQ